MNLFHHFKFAIISLFTVLLFQAPEAFAYKACHLNSGETITVGCTDYCGRFMRWGLNNAARRLGYNIKIVNLNNGLQSVDLSKIDAILIPGGADINPKYYTQYVEPELRTHIESLDYLVNYSSEGDRRDPFEYDLLQKYFEDDSLRLTPLLGICRGMQMLTVSQKIPLYVDIKKELGIKNRKYKLDKVYVIDGNSVIYDAVKDRKFRAVELHHQALRLDYFLENRERWPNVNISAVSNGGHIVEAIELTNRPALGVQFHPEYTFGHVRRGVFKWFLNRACQKKNTEI